MPKEIVEMVVAYAEAITSKCVFRAPVLSIVALSRDTFITLGSTTSVWKMTEMGSVSKLGEFDYQGSSMAKNGSQIVICDSDSVSTYTVAKRRKIANNPYVNMQNPHMIKIQTDCKTNFAIRKQHTIPFSGILSCLTIFDNCLVAVSDNGYTLCCWLGLSTDTPTHTTLRLNRCCHTILKLDECCFITFDNSEIGTMYCITRHGTLKKTGTLTGHTARIICALFLKNGIVATGSEDSTIRLWRDTTCIQTISMPDWPANISQQDSGNLVIGLYNASAVLITIKKDKSYMIASKTKISDSIARNSCAMGSKTLLAGNVLSLVE